MATTRLARNEAVAQREAEQAAQKAAFNLEAPLRLLQLMKLAYELDVNYRFTHSNPDGSINQQVAAKKEGAILVRFEIERPGYIEELVLQLGESEEYEFAHVQQRLQDIVDARKEAARQLEIARTAYDALTQEQRTALGLLRRP